MVAVILILAAVNLALYILRASDRPASPTPGELVYTTTFDAFNEQWAQFPGQITAEIANGQLTITNDSNGGGAYSDLERSFSDFDLRVDVTWVDSHSQADQIGVLFRYQDRDNYYVFKIRSDGAYRVEMLKDGQLDPVSQWQISPHIYTALNTVNQLRVVGKGQTFTFYANDRQLPLCLKGNDRRSTWTSLTSGECLSNNRQISESYNDISFAFGRIALGAVADQPGLKVTFDNVLVLGPG